MFGHHWARERSSMSSSARANDVWSVLLILLPPALLNIQPHTMLSVRESGFPMTLIAQAYTGLAGRAPPFVPAANGISSSAVKIERRKRNEYITIT